MNKGCLTGCVYLDLKKAFDTISHEILVNKLVKHGICGTEQEWFKHYLFERQQVVKLSEVLSDPMDIDVGVPQGSQLGPLLFSLYVNDLPERVKHCQINLFADDTSLYYSSDNLAVIQQKIQQDMDCIDEWLKENQLVLNVKKSKVMLIGTWQRLKNHRIIVKVGDDELEQVTKYKYLGVTIDDRLQWDRHLDTVMTKARYKVMLMRRNKAFLSQDLLNTMYIGLIRPGLEYCSTMFNNLSKEQTRKLEVIQNDALRVILHKGRRESGQEMRTILHIPTLLSRRTVKLACIIYKSINNGAPKYLLDLLPHQNQSITRSGGWVLQKCNLECYKSAYEYQSVVIWNSMGQDIKAANNYNNFK